MTDTPTDDEQLLSFDYQLDAPPEKVWRALTIPAFVERWLSPPADPATSVEAAVVEAVPPHRLSWDWREAGEPAGTVTFTLTPSDEGGTLLHLVHVRQSRPALSPAANNNFTPVMMMLAA